MSDPIEAGIQRQVQEVLAAALCRIPADGRWVVLQGALARALLPHLPRGGERPAIPSDLTQPQEDGDLFWGLGRVGPRCLRWMAQVLDSRHRQSAVHPWITIWAREAREDEQ